MVHHHIDETRKTEGDISIIYLPPFHPVSKQMQFVSFVVFVFLILIMTLAFAFWSYDLQRFNTSFEEKDFNLDLATPVYLFMGDPNEIQVTLVNKGDKALTMTVFFDYQGTGLTRTGNKMRTAVHFQELAPHARATDYFQIQFPLCYDKFDQTIPQQCKDREVTFDVRAEIAPDQNEIQLGTITFTLLNAPKPKALKNIFTGVAFALLVWSLKELWEWIKEFETVHRTIHKL